MKIRETIDGKEIKRIQSDDKKTQYFDADDNLLFEEDNKRLIELRKCTTIEELKLWIEKFL